MQAIAAQGGATIEILPKREASAIAFGIALAFAGWSTGLAAVATGMVLAASERDRRSGRKVSAATRIIRTLAVLGGYVAVVVPPLAAGTVSTSILAGLFIISLVARAERTLGEGTPDEVKAARRSFYLTGVAIALVVSLVVAALAVAVFLR